jgi:hypothetical protein
VNSRIEDPSKKDRHHIKIRSQDLPETDEQKKEKQKKEKLWEKIINFANDDRHATQGVELLKLKKLNYSEEVNDKGITISNLNGIKFSAMMPAEETDSSFTIHDLNTITENNQDESLARIKTDSKLFEFIQEVGAKPFTSIEECADFHYKLMQIIADQLELGVKIDTDFIEDPANEDVIMLIT